MTQQAIRQKAINEVVIDTRPVIEQFPHSIEAFFVLGLDDDDFDRAEAAYQDFVDAFNVSKDDVPLLRWITAEGVDKGSAAAPFSVVPDWAVEAARERSLERLRRRRISNLSDDM